MLYILDASSVHHPSYFIQEIIMIIIVMLTWSYLLFITILENEINFNKTTNEKQNKINKLNEN